MSALARRDDEAYREYVEESRRRERRNGAPEYVMNF